VACRIASLRNVLVAGRGSDPIPKGCAFRSSILEITHFLGENFHTQYWRVPFVLERIGNQIEKGMAIDVDAGIFALNSISKVKLCVSSYFSVLVARHQFLFEEFDAASRGKEIDAIHIETCFDKHRTKVGVQHGAGAVAN